MKTIVASDFKVTTADLEQFCADQQGRYDAHLSAMNYTHDVHKRQHKFSIGPRYARIFRATPDGRADSLVCFIDMTNGNILKGSWKAPVKNGVRGNIFTEDRGASVMTQYGCAYLR